MMLQEIYKEKGQELSRIWGKYINREATTKEIELALKHMKKLFHLTPNQRNASQTILKHPFFTYQIGEHPGV